MDPMSGQIYESREVALKAGVVNPVRIEGRLEDIERISAAVSQLEKREQKAAEKAKRRAKNKAAKVSRKRNRNG